MMDDTTDMPDADSDNLLLEGYQFVKWCGETVLSRSSLYFENSSNRLIVIEQIAAQVSNIMDFEDRFHHRLELLSSVTHTNLIRLSPCGYTSAGRHYLMKEHIEGQTLRQWMQHGEMNPAKAHHIILSVASALAEIHRHGAVHGALQADQVWIDHDGTVKLEICPVSTFLEPAELVRLLGLDVVHNMPPEFTSGAPLTAQSDLYQLAALYYEILSGNPPRGIITRLAPSLQIDIRVSSIILKALSANPEDRQANIEEFCAPLLGHTTTGVAAGEPMQNTPRPASKLLIVAATVICLAASTGSFLAWKWYQQRQHANTPVVTAEEPKPVKAINALAPSVVTPRCEWVGIQGDANQALIEFSLLNADELQHLMKPVADPENAAVFTPPQLTRYRFEDETGKPLTAAEPFVSADRIVFSLPIKLNEPIPQGICLVLQRADGQFALKSNIVPVSEAIAAHRQSHAAKEETPKEDIIPEEPKKFIPQLPTTPTASTTAGDFYIYAAHLYLGQEISLLKLEFGNAGKVMMRMNYLTFQCAFSIDHHFDTLLEATTGALPSHGKDLAAGGFTNQWLGLDQDYLLPEKKLWTKQTYRIDTSNPELLKTAKYLLVKINHRNTQLESNYENNLIVIPLDHPNQWHSYTQDPNDKITTEENDAATEKAPDAP